MTDDLADHWTTNEYRDSREDVASQSQGFKFRGHRCTLFYDCMEPSDDVISADTSHLWTGLYVVMDDSSDAFNESADIGSKTYATDDLSYSDIPRVAQSPKGNVFIHESKSLVEQYNGLDAGVHTKCSTDCLKVDITLSEIQHCKNYETSEIEKHGCTLSLDSRKEHQRQTRIGTAINSRHSSRHRHLNTTVSSRHLSRLRHINTSVSSRHSVHINSLKRYHLFSPHSGKRKCGVRRRQIVKSKLRTNNKEFFTDSTCNEHCSDHRLNKKITTEQTLQSSFAEANVATTCYVLNDSSPTFCARLWCNNVPENEVIKHSETAYHLQCESEERDSHLTTNYLLGCHPGSQENYQMSRELILKDSDINKEFSTLIGNLNRELYVRSSNVHRSELGRLNFENKISLTNDTGLDWNSNADEHLRHEKDEDSRLTDPILTNKLKKIREDREGLIFVLNLLLTWNILQLLVLFGTLFYACICICSFRHVFGCGELCLLKPKPQPKSAKKRWWSI